MKICNARKYSASECFGFILPKYDHQKLVSIVKSD